MVASADHNRTACIPGCSNAVIHYAEIALKGKNRAAFENRLARNVQRKLGDVCRGIQRESGLIVATLDDHWDPAGVTDILARIPGIAHFSYALRGERDITALGRQIVSRLEGFGFSSFKIDCRRADKSYPLNSMEVNASLGDMVRRAGERQVQLADPELTIKVEILKRNIYVSFGDYAGVGGMPTDNKQHVIALLSGGFDSPVAAYLMMKRGCRVSLVHFQNRLQARDGVENKVIRLAEQLSNYQVGTRLAIVPFEDIQQEIIMKVPAAMRMLVYRRFMIHLGARMANEYRARFLVVGDSLSQVASQTLSNLYATYSKLPVPIFTPLIGMDKKEIIAIARAIGTYEISALPYGDCCSYFVPRHPELRAKPEMLDRLEQQFDIPHLIETVIKDSQLHQWD